MNLIWRLFLLLLRKVWNADPRTPLESSDVEFWCLPHDCDFNMHMTNSRYPSFCDLARIGALMDHGALKKLMKRGCTPIMTAQQLINHKEIAPFRKFRITSRILGWDERFWIFRHDFYQDGILRATVLAKGVFVRKKKIVPFARILEIAGYELDSPELPDYANDWSRNSDRLFQTFKRGRG